MAKKNIIIAPNVPFPKFDSRYNPLIHAFVGKFNSMPVIRRRVADYMGGEGGTSVLSIIDYLNSPIAEAQAAFISGRSARDILAGRIVRGPEIELMGVYNPNVSVAVQRLLGMFSSNGKAIQLGREKAFYVESVRTNTPPKYVDIKNPEGSLKFDFRLTPVETAEEIQSNARPLSVRLALLSDKMFSGETVNASKFGF